MADAPKTSKPTADELSEQAREAELKRQEDQVAAVAKANKEELPKLGGPLLEPGLGR